MSKTWRSSANPNDTSSFPHGWSRQQLCFIQQGCQHTGVLQPWPPQIASSFITAPVGGALQNQQTSPDARRDLAVHRNAQMGDFWFVVRPKLPLQARRTSLDPLGFTAYRKIRLDLIREVTLCSASCKPSWNLQGLYILW